MTMEGDGRADEVSVKLFRSRDRSIRIGFAVVSKAPPVHRRTANVVITEHVAPFAMPCSARSPTSSVANAFFHFTQAIPRRREVYVLEASFTIKPSLPRPRAARKAASISQPRVNGKP